MRISENIKSIRKRYGLTQAQLGKIAGVSDKAVSTWEKGTAEPRMGAIENIAEYFHIKKTEILDGPDDGENLDYEPLATNDIYQLIGALLSDNPENGQLMAVVTISPCGSISSFNQSVVDIDNFTGNDLSNIINIITSRPHDSALIIRKGTPSKGIVSKSDIEIGAKLINILGFTEIDFDYVFIYHGKVKSLKKANMI